MSRTWRSSWIALSLLAAVVTAVAQDKPNPKQAFLDAKEAGPDFQLQGEYVGKVGDQSFGAQIIARGTGKFDGVIFPGELPGAGWDAEKKEKHKVSGETKDGATTLAGGDFEATIVNGALVLKQKDESGELKRLHRESPSIGMRAPEGALILFDGSNVDHWNPGKLAVPV